jgi:general secretion pathway protein G
MVKLFPTRLSGHPFTPLERGILSLAVAIVAFGAVRFCITSYLASQNEGIHSAREAVLREDCRVVHQAIDNYSLDLHKAPQSLDDLIQTGYLKALPRGFSLEACK